MPYARSSVAVVALTAAACTPITVLHDVPYDDRFGTSTIMDVYLPNDGAAGRPAVLAIHGGGWRIGSKDMEAGLCRRLAHSGWVCASINYRLSDEAMFPAAIQDSKCALIFLRANAGEYGLDPARVAVTGYSAGGHLTALLAASEGTIELEPDCAVASSSPEPARVAAAMPGAGPTDLRPLDFASAITDFLGGTFEDLPGTYSLASPIDYVRPGLMPFLFIQGSVDSFVPPGQSRRMHEALLAVGSPSRLLAMTGASHLFQPGLDPEFFAGPAASQSTNDSWAAMADFLIETMGAP